VVEQSEQRHVLTSKVKDLEGGMNCLNYKCTLDSEEKNERENNLFSSMFIFKTV